MKLFGLLLVLGRLFPQVSSCQLLLLRHQTSAGGILKRTGVYLKVVLQINGIKELKILDAVYSHLLIGFGKLQLYFTNILELVWFNPEH